MQGSLRAPLVVVRRWSMLLSGLRAKSARGKNNRNMIIVSFVIAMASESNRLVDRSQIVFKNALAAYQKYKQPT